MPKGKPIIYSELELSWAKANCSLISEQYVMRFNLKFNRNLNASNLNALRKRNGWKTGRDGRFYKGQTFNPKSGAKGPNKTSFKKGHTSQNKRPLGSERICSKDGYVYIKTKEPNKFELKHKFLWELENGEVPKGCCLICLDGAKVNCSPDNWMLITRADLVRLNQFCARNKIDYYGIDKDSRKAAIAIAVLKSKTADLRQIISKE